MSDRTWVIWCDTADVVDWDVQHFAWNAVATIVWVVAAVLIVRLPDSAFKTGRRGKIFALVFALAPSLYVSGYFVPLGAICILYVALRKRPITPRGDR